MAEAVEKTIPVKVGELVDLRVDDIVAGGEGIGRVQGYAVFVPYGAPGDTLRVRIISTKPGYARGLVEAIVERGPGRSEPPCSLFGTCGGCQLQHLAYPDQLAIKERLVREALERIAKLDASGKVRPIAGMGPHRSSGTDASEVAGLGITTPEPWNYRNKAHWALSYRSGKVCIGLYRPRSHDIVEPEPCFIQHPLLNLVMDFLRKELQDHEFRIYDERTGKGWLRSAFAKVAHSSDELMIGLVAINGKFPTRDVFVDSITHQFPGVRSVVLNIQPERTNVLMGRHTEILWGTGHITEQIGDLSFRLSPRSFFQVNPWQTAELYRHVVELAGLTGAETVVDAYSGTGTIALALAGRAAEVWGIELEAEAVADAESNAKLNGIGNAHFLPGRCEERLPRMIKDGLIPDVVVLDPPRKGCDPEVIAAIAAAAPARVVYVSCNPATLARDLAAFRDAGFELRTVQPVDMFPQTAHVEAVALLEPASGGRATGNPNDTDP